ncbi:MAG: SDR family oxidoreductase [Proteobacteria bacterium]|nr:SDR family oxidoreductase [Pseudomonadota bacterium]
MRDYKGKNCIVFGANSVVGMEISASLSQGGANLGLIDLDSYKHDALVENVGHPGATVAYKTVLSGRKDSFKEAVDGIVNDLGSVDYLICAFYLEEERKKRDPDDLDVDTWDELLKEWVLNYFLVTKTVVPYMIQRKAGRIVFVNTTTGYTGEGEGEGELTGGGSVYECACSSGITGMMTSIARDIIPKGISVNGIALGPNYEDNMERVIWATDLWLSGICEYACAQILRLY